MGTDTITARPVRAADIAGGSSWHEALAARYILQQMELRAFIDEAGDKVEEYL